MNTLTATELFLTNRKATGVKATTRRWYLWALRRFTKFSPELPLEPEPIEEYLSTFPDEKDETRYASYRILHAFYRFLYRRRKIPNNPFDFMDPPRRTPKVQPTLEPREMLRLSVQPDNARDRAILTLLFDSGIRATELVTLRKQYIFEDHILVTGKRGQRLVPISEETRRMLLFLVSPDSDLVFRGQRGPLTYSGLYQLVKKCLVAASISGPKMGPHRLRHTVGKTFLENGGDIRTLQKILGHASIKTTEVYTNLANRAVIEKHHQFTPLRALHGAAQENLFTSSAIQEAEVILEKKKLTS